MSKKVKRICQGCGIEFEARASDVARGYAKFHNKACAGKSRRGSRNSFWQGGRNHKRDFRDNNYKERHPLKIKAKRLLEYAVRTGRIIKPKKCSRCKRKKPVQGHHPDYSKPYDVKWLCQSCHTTLHKELKQEEIASVFCPPTEVPMPDIWVFGFETKKSFLST